jgi:heme exporter protein CcmB
MRKDMTVEVRSREILLTTLFFAVSVVLLFSFALVREGRAPDDVAAGILWVAIAFSGTLAMGRTFERERYNDTLRALILAPADRSAIYAGKFLGLLLLMGIVEIILVPLIGLLFAAPIFTFPIQLALLLISGTMGFAAVGTLFAAMLVRVRSRDALLPVLLYPITVPVMIAGVRGTAALFQPTPDEAMAQFWIFGLIFWDAVFITLALWTFEPVMTE